MFNNYCGSGSAGFGQVSSWRGAGVAQSVQWLRYELDNRRSIP